MKLELYTILFVLLLVGSCSKDHGNYDYSEVNSISIDSIKESYSVVQFDTLTITPYLKFKQEEIKNLSFEWKVNNEVISTDPVCHAQIRMAANEGSLNAHYDALLIVTNEENGLKYYKNFDVKVGTAYSNALLILSAQADEQAILSFQRRDKANMPIEHQIFEAANPRLGSLGKKPRQVWAGGTQTKMCIVLCEEGPYKMVCLNLTSMQLMQAYDTETIMSYDGPFTPYGIKMYMGGICIAKEGLFGYNYMNSMALYRPIAGDYEFAYWVDCNKQMDAYMWLSYDNKSERFTTLEITQGIAYDKVTPLESEEFSTAGQKFLTGGHAGIETSRPVLYDATTKTAYFYSIEMTADEWDPVTWDPIWVINYHKIMEKTGLMDENSVTVFGENSLYWFIANDNKIVRLHGDGGEIRDVFAAPKGKVMTMMLDKQEERLFVVTYDGNKSYIYAVNVVSDFGALTEEPLEMEGKIVSITSTGTWKY